ISVQLFSSLKKEGVPELCSYLNKIFEVSNEG
ncbi:MAG: YihA family ribosome biogenesis GTP-binding protein, partial [Gammaproteobacteria bacterium]|nr:YihA family ribosome biogenesis GTP-binding protein [Gammaproteobacteria bacterium]